MAGVHLPPFTLRPLHTVSHYLDSATIGSRPRDDSAAPPSRPCVRCYASGVIAAAIVTGMTIAFARRMGCRRR